MYNSSLCTLVAAHGRPYIQHTGIFLSNSLVFIVPVATIGSQLAFFANRAFRVSPVYTDSYSIQRSSIISACNLPVEYASAGTRLEWCYLSRKKLHTRKVLNAAALTYVAAT